MVEFVFKHKKSKLYRSNHNESWLSNKINILQESDNWLTNDIYKAYIYSSYESNQNIIMKRIYHLIDFTQFDICSIESKCIFTYNKFITEVN